MSNTYTIKGMDTFKRVSLGHLTHITGTGAYRNRKQDKKLRRLADRRAIKGE